MAWVGLCFTGVALYASIALHWAMPARLQKSDVVVGVGVLFVMATFALSRAAYPPGWRRTAGRAVAALYASLTVLSFASWSTRSPANLVLEILEPIAQFGLVAFMTFGVLRLARGAATRAGRWAARAALVSLLGWVAADLAVRVGFWVPQLISTDASVTGALVQWIERTWDDWMTVWRIARRTWEVLLLAAILCIALRLRRAAPGPMPLLHVDAAQAWWRGRCIGCGQILAGLTRDSNCPECGMDAEQAHQIGAGRRRLAAIVLWSLAALLTTITLAFIASSIPVLQMRRELMQQLPLSNRLWTEVALEARFWLGWIIRLMPVAWLTAGVLNRRAMAPGTSLGLRAVVVSCAVALVFTFALSLLDQTGINLVPLIGVQFLQVAAELMRALVILAAAWHLHQMAVSLHAQQRRLELFLFAAIVLSSVWLAGRSFLFQRLLYANPPGPQLMRSLFLYTVVDGGFFVIVYGCLIARVCAVARALRSRPLAAADAHS